MNVEVLREYALSKPFAEEGFPFGEETLVFKVKGKMFLLLSLDAVPPQFNAKCDPDKAIELRDEFPGTVIPGYHMNKKHWNTVILNGTLSSNQIKELVDDSYNLVKGKTTQ